MIHADCLLMLLVTVPAIAAAACFLLPDRACKIFALIASLVGFWFSMDLYWQFQNLAPGQFQFVFAVPWIKPYNIQFGLAVDGLSFPMVVLTKFMVPIAILASWKETRNVRAYMACFLLLDTAMTGTFLATDIFLFYVFWELMLIPMLLLIGVWGSKERIYAALKFFIFTFAGSILMLVAIFWLFIAHQEQFGAYSSEIKAFSQVTFPGGPVWAGLTVQDLIFLAFTIAFLIKVPLFPLHTWLPDAHVQAPTGGSILLAAVLLKMGTYGLLRFSIPLCPLSFMKFAPYLAGLSLIGVLYGAWVAFQQTDMKKLVAYSSVSHLAYVVLGICSVNNEGLTGSVLQMVNHGLSTGALFFLVGALYERRHSRNFADFGGLAEFMPFFAFFLVFVSCSSMAVPGLNGFIGEFLILFGSFKANDVWGAIACTGVVFGAVYTLTMLRKVLFGPTLSAENRLLKDLDKREWAVLIPMCALMLALGIAPNFFLKKFDQTLEGYWNASIQRILPPKDVKVSVNEARP